MIISRIAPLAASAARSTFNGGRKMFSTTTIRSGGHGPFNYRSLPAPNTFNERYAEVCGAIMWWWIFWHFMTDYEHIVGHFEFPEARSWTDAELGIPPDDAEDPEMAEPIPPPSVFAFRQTKPDYPC